jgi:uncharacterized membrane protein YkvA (DUF1232 family)
VDAVIDRRASRLKFARMQAPLAERKRTSKVGRARALLRYFRDPRASILGKLFVFAAVVYVIMPVDLIPDVPVVGWLDDLGVMSLAVAWMWKVVAKYREAPQAHLPTDRAEIVV